MDWPIIGDNPVLDKLDSHTRDAVIAAATQHLSRWTGGVYGLTPVTIRPCRAPRQVKTREKWSPFPRGGVWWPLACHTCDSSLCGCDKPDSLRFPFRIHEITSITINGNPLGPDEWVADGRVLHRVGGSWPTRQDPRVPPATFEIQLVKGVPVPEGGQLAAAVLAEEIAKAVTGDQTCKLPARVQTLTRQGVTVGMFDSMADLADGQTGLWLVDSWIASVTKAPRIGGLWSPDSDPGRVRYA